jgi:hypothetical protein
MKKIIIAFLGIGLFCLLMNSCRKNDISGDSKDLILGSYVTLDSTINTNLNISDPASVVSIKIAKTVGSPVASINIYAATGAAEDTTTWVLIKNVAYSDGVVLTVTTTELATAFGSTPLAAGNQYVIQNQVVTKDGRKFSVWNTPDTYNSFPAYHMALTWTATAVCAFNQSDAVGTYKVVSDKNWQDFSPGDLITVSAGPDANSISFLAYPSPAAGGTNRQPWIVEVNPVTDVATMATQYVGDYPGAPGSNASAKGLVFSCTGYITLTVTITYGGTPYTGQVLVLQKQ